MQLEHTIYPQPLLFSRVCAGTQQPPSAPPPFLTSLLAGRSASVAARNVSTVLGPSSSATCMCTVCQRKMKHVLSLQHTQFVVREWPPRAATSPGPKPQRPPAPSPVNCTRRLTSPAGPAGVMALRNGYFDVLPRSDLLPQCLWLRPSWSA